MSHQRGPERASWNKSAQVDRPGASRRLHVIRCLLRVPACPCQDLYWVASHGYSWGPRLGIPQVGLPAQV